MEKKYDFEIGYQSQILVKTIIIIKKRILMFEILNLKNNPENNPKILKIIFEIFAKNWFPLIK